MVVDVCQMCAPRSCMARTCDLHETNSSLTGLNLKFNEIGDEGGCALAAALRATLVLCTRCSCGCSAGVVPPVCPSCELHGIMTVQPMTFNLVAVKRAPEGSVLTCSNAVWAGDTDRFSVSGAASWAKDRLGWYPLFENNLKAVNDRTQQRRS